MMTLQALRKGNWEERTNMIQCDFKITTRIMTDTIIPVHIQISETLTFTMSVLITFIHKVYSK